MKLRIAVVLCLSLSSCAQNEGNLVPLERTAIFSADKAADLIRTVCYSPPDVTGYWTPQPTELTGIEQTLIEFLRSQGDNETKDWTTFRRQVAGVQRDNERLVFIYYFDFDRKIEDYLVKRKEPNFDPNAWKSEPRLIFDGGESIFRVLYDIKRKKFIWYECNGVA